MADETDIPANSGPDSDAWGEDKRSDSLAWAERILNQDEIDSLLGFDLSDEDASER